MTTAIPGAVAGLHERIAELGDERDVARGELATAKERIEVLSGLLSEVLSAHDAFVATPSRENAYRLKDVTDTIRDAIRGDS